MSDWAAKLSRNPKPVQLTEASASHGQTTSQAAGEKGSATASGVGQPKQKKNGDNNGTHKSTEEPRKAPKPEDTLKAESYNYSEVLQFLHTRFERDLADARRDKGNEDTVIYRSLDSASAWNTASTSSKKGSDEEGFNLLRELNRSTVKTRRP